MMRTRLAFLVTAAAAVLLVAGVVRLFVIRFQAGDIYPPYSSLRSDPLGTHALYESLARCRSLDVSRNYGILRDLDFPGDTTLLFLGDTISPRPDLERVSSEMAAAANAFMRRGGRMVITLQPRTWDPKKFDEETGLEDEPEKEKPGAKHDAKAEETRKEEEATEKEKATPPRRKNKDEEERLSLPLTNWLETGITHVNPRSLSAPGTLDPALAGSGLPGSLECHTLVCFTNPAPAWRVIYRRGADALVMERTVGRGSMVLSSLSYFASNEALRDDRHPTLLAWMIGPHRRVVFDETHHAIYAAPGVAWLVRKYSLHWFGFGLLVLAVLFVWQSASSLVPRGARPGMRDGPQAEAGKDSASGLINILRRNIPPSALLETCLQEWARGVDIREPAAESRLLRAREILRSGAVAGTPVVEQYEQISRILNEKTETGRRVP